MDRFTGLEQQNFVKSYQFCRCRAITVTDAKEYPQAIIETIESCTSCFLRFYRAIREVIHGGQCICELQQVVCSVKVILRLPWSLRLDVPGMDPSSPWDPYVPYTPVNGESRTPELMIDGRNLPKRQQQCCVWSFFSRNSQVNEFLHLKVKDPIAMSHSRLRVSQN